MAVDPSIIPEQKAALQARAALDVLADYKIYRTEVLTDGDADDMRKLVEMQMKLIGAEADKKQDQNSNLPVFNFIFHGGSVQAVLQAEPPPLVEVVEATPLLSPFPDPGAVETCPRDVLDLDALLADIDAQLGGEGAG